MMFTAYRTFRQLDLLLTILENVFPNLCKRFELPHKSVQGFAINAVRIRAGAGKRRRGILIVGGIHARELMNPDAIIELAFALTRSYTDRTDIILGNRRWKAPEIKLMLEALDVWLLPCANPDGRNQVMARDDLWRKNLRITPGVSCTGGGFNRHGVDVNRNLDFVWGVTTAGTSCNPCNDTYVGEKPFSEPESLNIKHLCDTRRIDVFLDVHSYSEFVLHPWGHAPLQTTDPTKRFTNLATRTCAPLAPANHQEYMSPRDQFRFQRVARRVADDITAVRNRTYRAGSIHALMPYTVTGSSTDYTYSRHIAIPTLRKTYGFAFETGPNTGNDRTSFHPADPTPIKLETQSGMISLINQTVCAIELLGALLPASPAPAMRAVRDERLATTAAGRKLIALFERVQVPLLAAMLADESLMRSAMDLLERAEKLLRNDKAIVSDRDVKRGLALLDTLTDRAASGSIRRDLDTVRKLLAKAGRKRVGAIIDGLLETRRRPVSKKRR